MTIPPFSQWLHWDQRATCEHRNGPGVYLLARFEERPPQTVDTVDQQVLLIAETHGQTLSKRWDQFHYSAFGGKWGHAGGVTFHELFGNGPDTATPPWLYFSAAPVPQGTIDVRAYVQGLKNSLLEAYLDRNGLLPRCNVRGPVDSSVVSDESPALLAPSTQLTPLPISEPALQFSRWCRWVERITLDGTDAAGVYALACFDGEPPSVVDVLDERTVYLGETCDNSLAGRLLQFNRSAFLGKDGHSGGWSFSSRCAGLGDQLYVSVFPLSTLHEPHRSSFIRYTERRLLWEYVLRWGRRPICNSK